MTSHPCTLVTCYYRFPSKHSYEAYRAWMSNLLEHTHPDVPMVIFTDEVAVRDVSSFRQGKEALTRIVLKPLDQTTCGRRMDYWLRDHARDHEARLHTPLLYLVWNQKTDFVREAIQSNFFDTPYYMWCDIGCFRTSPMPERFRQFPDPDCIRAIPKGKMVLNLADPYMYSDLNNIQQDPYRNYFRETNRIGGTIYVGDTEAWARWIPAYYHVLGKFMENDEFCGKDQSILSTVALLLLDYCHIVRIPGPEFGDRWFYLQVYLTQGPGSIL